MHSYSFDPPNLLKNQRYIKKNGMAAQSCQPTNYHFVRSGIISKIYLF